MLSRFIISVPSIPWSCKRPLCVGFVTKLCPVRASCFAKPIGFDLISVLLKSIEAFQGESFCVFSLRHHVVPKTVPWMLDAVPHARTAVSANRSFFFKHYCLLAIRTKLCTAHINFTVLWANEMSFKAWGRLISSDIIQHEILEFYSPRRSHGQIRLSRFGFLTSTK
jgi:hypothetical protein